MTDKQLLFLLTTHLREDTTILRMHFEKGGKLFIEYKIKGGGYSEVWAMDSDGNPPMEYNRWPL